MTLHFLNDVVNDIEWTRKIDENVMIASLNNKSACKLINKIPGHVSSRMDLYPSFSI